jgi:hypothetical protein
MRLKETANAVVLLHAQHDSRHGENFTHDGAVSLILSIDGKRVLNWTSGRRRTAHRADHVDEGT